MTITHNLVILIHTTRMVFFRPRKTVDAVPACESNPCLNGGLCLESGGQTLYICQCQAPFTGNNCENGEFTLFK